MNDKIRVYENFCIGDEVRFNHDEKEMTGTIESANERHIIIKPDKECGRFYDGYRITISKIDLYRSVVIMKPKSNASDLTRNDDGTYTL